MGNVRILVAVSHRGRNHKVGDIVELDDADATTFAEHGWGEATDDDVTPAADAAPASAPTPADGADAGGDQPA